MAGLVPAIHVLRPVQNVDVRDKPGHDVVEAVAQLLRPYFFTSGHSLSLSGLAASSAAIVAICL
ncbi:hypothetical protein ACVIQY_000381 [Bradyrhizobium sp. USDA 3051]|jgi:hypothetical protein